jgi:hypothetical protein
MNNTNKTMRTLFLSVILITSFLFSLSIINAALVSPANSATLAGTIVLNATNASLPNIQNCTFYAKSANTANSSWTSLGSADNESANAGNINKTFNTAGLEDGLLYTFNATCRNISNSLTSAVSTATITINNTIPTAAAIPSPASASSITAPATTTLSATVVDRETTGCTYTIYRGSADSSSSTNYQSGTATYSGSTCSFTKQFSSGNTGTWTWTITATDGLDSTTSTFTLNNKIPTGGSVVISPETVVTTGITSTSFMYKVVHSLDWIINWFKSFF